MSIANITREILDLRSNLERKDADNRPQGWNGASWGLPYETILEHGTRSVQDGLFSCEIVDYHKKRFTKE